MTTGNGTALVRAEYSGLQMALAPAEAKRRHQELVAFVAAVMQPGVDFGRIQGTDKDCLFQPGAQKLCEVYGFAWEFADVTTVEDWERPFFFYRRRCILTSRRDGSYIGDGRGSCNSREDRYAWRWVWGNDVPAGIDKATLKKREFQKTGRTFTKFRLPNEDIFSLVNTLEKMACKRALVHAVIGATRSAGVFTQDVEDLPAEAFGRVEEHRSWEGEPEPERPAPPPAKPGPAKAAPPPTESSPRAIEQAAPAPAKADRPAPPWGDDVPTPEQVAQAFQNAKTYPELQAAGTALNVHKGPLYEHLPWLRRLYAERRTELQPAKAGAA